MDDTQRQDNATDTQEPEVKFATKNEFTDFVKTKISEALAPKLRQIETLEAKSAEADELKKQLEEMQERANGSQKSTQEKWEAEKQKWQQQHTALQEQIMQAQQAHDLTRQKWQAEKVDNYLTRIASPYASKTALSDIAALYPRDQIQITEGDNGLKISIIDPQTGIEQDPAQAMQAWLQTRPHLMAAPPQGAGAPGAGPPRDQSPRDKFNELSPGEQMRTAMREVYKKQGLI